MAKRGKEQEVELTKLKPYEKNAKIHSPAQVQKIADSIQEFGFLNACLIDKDYNIIAGHGRVEAAKLLGMETVPCTFIEGLTEEQRKAYILADNKLTELGEWDFDIVFDELQGLNFDLALLTGFDVPEQEDFFQDRERWNRERQEGNNEYNDFLAKFEEAKTTDDCYTPDNIYESVAEYVAQRYGLKRENFVRPFYPGGDYQKHKYREQDVVVDNPPFSILSEILRWYVENNVRFFLFAPTLTLFSGRGLDICYLPVGVTVEYENGALVNTSFITNLEKDRIHTLPDLYNAVFLANKENNKNKKQVPKYEFPDSVVTAAALSRLSVYGVEFSVQPEECARISELDAMKEVGKAIYGGGYLLGEKATARHKEAEKLKQEMVNKKEIERLNQAINSGGCAMREDGVLIWELSEREKKIVKSLNKGA